MHCPNFLRVVVLLRASTKQQTDDKNDIPAQRHIVNDFIQSHKDWVVIKEFVEGGISGFKTPTDKRDALTEIKKMALNSEFDILVVYMSDRIGRLSDETPLVISFLNENQVKILSVCEGEIKSDSHAEKLVTYIRYWQAEGESLKIAQRVASFQKAAIERGNFRGGSYIPFGYERVENGRKNEKGRQILDLVINPREAEIVKLIYDLSINNNYGQSKIARYLNEKGYSNRGKSGWHATTIQYILQNRTYMGRLHMHSNYFDVDVVSDIQEDLVIIPEHKWYENRMMVDSRSYSKKNEVTEDRRTKNTHGRLLLSGIVFCGHCGFALTTMTAQNNKTLANGEKTKVLYHKYRCASFYKKGAVKCDGQSTYATSRIDPIVLEETKQFLASIQEKNSQELYLEKINSSITHYESVLKKREKEAKELLKQSSTLKKEIAKALVGKSKFTPEELKGAIDLNSEETLETQNEIEEYKNKLVDLKEKKHAFATLDNQIPKWSNQFDTMDFNTQKALLATLIDKVIVYKDSIEIIYNIKLETYLESCKDTQYVRVLR